MGEGAVASGLNGLTLRPSILSDITAKAEPPFQNEGAEEGSTHLSAAPTINSASIADSWVQDLKC